METEQVDNRLIYCLNEALDEAAKAAYKRLKAIAKFADSVMPPFAMYAAVCDIDITEGRYYHSLSSKIRYYCDDINGGNYTLRFTRECGDVVVFSFNRYDNTIHSEVIQTYELSLNEVLQLLGVLEVHLCQRENEQEALKDYSLSVFAKIDCLIGASVDNMAEIGMSEFDANKLYLYLSANVVYLRLKAIEELAKENDLSTSYFIEFKVVFKDDNDTTLLETTLKDQGRTLIMPCHVGQDSVNVSNYIDLTCVNIGVVSYVPLRVVKKILKATKVEIIHEMPNLENFDSPDPFTYTSRIVAQAKL